ncbi:MAG: hypothetical protein ACLUEQ_07055 [Cloacibacillus evryensis]
MRDSEGRQRHFVIRDKKDESYDSPSVRRRGVIKEREEMEEALEEPRAAPAQITARARDGGRGRAEHPRRGRGNKRIKRKRITKKRKKKITAPRLPKSFASSPGSR